MLLSCFAVGPFEHEAMPSRLNSATRRMILLKNVRGFVLLCLSISPARPFADSPFQSADRAAGKIPRPRLPRVPRPRPGNRLDAVVPSLRDRGGCVVT